MEKELTPRQIREHAVYEAAKEKPNETPTDRRNNANRLAGWPIKEVT